MEEWINLEPWWRFAAALLVGALIGLEREFIQQRRQEGEFAGIRTFGLMALLGAVGAFAAQEQGLWLFLVVYLGLILLVWAGYLGDILGQQQEGITTEVAALLTPLLGALMVWGRADVAAGLGVIVALVLALKPTLHSMARTMSSADLRATLQFALISAVILPLLPNRSMGPYEVLNPFEIWLLVVFVSGISFLGYILMKVLGAEKGIGLTGLLGGLASSTAVTLSFAGRSKENAELSGLFAVAVILASNVMFPRVMIEILVVHAPLLNELLLPMGAMLLTGLLYVGILWRRQGELLRQDQEAMSLSNPLKLSTAIGFGLAFAFVLLVVRWANATLGNLGVYLASALAGLTDVDAITLSVSELAAKSQLDLEVAGLSVLLAVLVNTAVKAVTVALLGAPALRRIVLQAFGLMILVGIISGGLQFVF